MAKKTRKEKIIAQYRRKLQLLEIKDKPLEIKKTNTQNLQIIDLSQDDQTTKKYFISDFRKSLIIVVTVIALEIGLYFATMLINKF